MTWENPSKGAPQHLRKKALHRDHHQCTQCGATHNLEVDHIHNVASGGTHHIDNLQTLCRECHREKTRREMRAGHQNRKNRAKYPKEQHPGLKTL